MTRRITTASSANERALLAKFRTLTPHGQKALHAWADFLRLLFPDARRILEKRNTRRRL